MFNSVFLTRKKGFLTIASQVALKALLLARSFGAVGRDPAFPPASLVPSRSPGGGPPLSGQLSCSGTPAGAATAHSQPFHSPCAVAQLAAPSPRCGRHSGKAGDVGLVLPASGLSQGGCSVLCSLGDPPPGHPSWSECPPLVSWGSPAPPPRVVAALVAPSPQPSLHFPGVTETFFLAQVPAWRAEPTQRRQASWGGQLGFPAARCCPGVMACLLSVVGGRQGRAARD